MNEPANLTAVVDRHGGIWVRVDECPGRFGTWHPVPDGPGFNITSHDHQGRAWPWPWLNDAVYDDPCYAPLTVADAGRTARALRWVQDEDASALRRFEGGEETGMWEVRL